MASYVELDPNKKGEPGIKITVEQGYDETGERIRFHKTVRMKKLSDRAIKKAITDFEIEVAKMEKVKLENITFACFVERWMKNYVIPDLSVKTKSIYAYHLKNGVLEKLGHYKLNKIKTFNLVEIINEWKDESVGMSSSKYDVLSSVFKKAVEWKLLKENPLDGIKKPKKVNKEKELEYYDEKQLIQLLKILKKVNIKHNIQIKLAALVGLRMGEIGGIRLECINFLNNTIKIDKSLQYDDESKKLVLGATKNKKTRFVKVPTTLMNELELYVKEHRKLQIKSGAAWNPMKDDRDQPINFLFTRTDGYPLNPRNISNEWRKIIAKYNLPKITFHNLRHTYATFMRYRGVDYKIIQEQLGHSNVDMTIGTYSHLTEKEKEEASALFDEIL